MADQTLKDKLGNILGKISTASNGILTIKDKLGNVKGSFDPKTNKTKDKLGNVIGSGNLLATLL